MDGSYMKLNKLVVAFSFGLLSISSHAVIDMPEYGDDSRKLNCVNPNIFEKVICENVHLDKFDEKIDSYVLNENEEIFYTESGFLDGRIERDGCSYEMKGRGGYANITMLQSSELSFFGDGIIEPKIIVFSPAAEIFITQKLKDRQGFKKPIVGGCTHSLG
jgi:hypothetical protein